LIQFKKTFFIKLNESEFKINCTKEENFVFHFERPQRIRYSDSLIDYRPIKKQEISSIEKQAFRNCGRNNSIHGLGQNKQQTDFYIEILFHFLNLCIYENLSNKILKLRNCVIFEYV